MPSAANDSREGPASSNNFKDSKCDRALTAPPGFKSLMLRQKRPGVLFLERWAVFLCKIASEDGQPSGPAQGYGSMMPGVPRAGPVKGASQSQSRSSILTAI